jgi:hypothetical protein
MSRTSGGRLQRRRQSAQLQSRRVSRGQWRRTCFGRLRAATAQTRTPRHRDRRRPATRSAPGRTANRRTRRRVRQPRRRPAARCTPDARTPLDTRRVHCRRDQRGAAEARRDEIRASAVCFSVGVCLSVGRRFSVGDRRVSVAGPSLSSQNRNAVSARGAAAAETVAETTMASSEAATQSSQPTTLETRARMSPHAYGLSLSPLHAPLSHPSTLSRSPFLLRTCSTPLLSTCRAEYESKVLHGSYPVANLTYRRVCVCDDTRIL